MPTHRLVFAAYFGWFLVGPAFTGLIYLYMGTGMQTHPLHTCSHNVVWANNIGVTTDECPLDIGQRVRCSKHNETAMLGIPYPPTVTEVVNEWTHVGVLTLGMGSVSLLVALVTIGSSADEYFVSTVAYFTTLAVFGVIGTSDYQDETSITAYAHWGCVIVMLVTSFMITYTLQTLRDTQYRSTVTTVLQAFQMLGMLAVIGTGVLLQFWNTQTYVGWLALAEQAYLNLFVLQLTLLIRNKSSRMPNK